MSFVKPQSQITTPQIILQRALELRCKQNPRYSMRAFASSLGVSQTLLSLLIAGKKPFSKKMIQKMVDTIELKPQELSDLVSSKNKNNSAPDISMEMPVDQFSMISEWHYYAILSLLDLPSFKMSSKWIAHRIGISEAEAKIALKRLLEMEIIDKDDDGKWVQVCEPIRVKNQTSTQATKKFQKQLLNKAAESLDTEPFEQRVVSAITFAANDKTVAYARKRIHEFREQLCSELEEMSTPNRVYNFCLQFYPVSKKEKSND